MLRIITAGIVALLIALGLVLGACAPVAQEAPTSTPTVRTTPTPTPTQGACTQGAWSSTEAAEHIGQRGTVYGPVVDTRYATASKGQPTFLNFDRPYPNHIFTVVIWGSDRGNFPASPESYYRGKTVCATGLIESYRGKPQIIARNGNQLQVAR